MKTYRVVLESFGPVFVDAESVMENEQSLEFVRNGEVCAHYARASVQSYELAAMAPMSFPMAEREDSQAP